MNMACVSKANDSATASPPPLAGEGQGGGMHQDWFQAGYAESNGSGKNALSPPLPRRKSGLPDLRRMIRTPGKPGGRRGREHTEFAAPAGAPGWK
jgi:hypothetical protein